MEYLAHFFLFLSCVITDAAISNNVDTFAQHLKEISVDSLGVDVLQNHFDAITSIKNENRRITAVMDQVVKKFKDRLLIAENALNSLKTFLESDDEVNRNAVSGRTEIFDCCGYSENLKFHSLFQTQVNLKKFCEISPLRSHSSCPRASPKSVRLLDENSLLTKLTQVFRDSNRLVHYIYYGRDDGYYVQFPAQNNMDAENPCACAKHDPRFTPWYVSAMTPLLGKDVVIAIDLSSSMKNFRLVMVNIFNVLIDTLDGKDRILVLFFKGGVQHPYTGRNDCLKTLTYATPATGKALKEYIQTVDFSGSLNYVNLFEKSLSVYDDNGSTKLLHVITSGEYTDLNKDDIISKVTTKSGQFNCSLTLNMFLVTSGSFAAQKREAHTEIVDAMCSSSRKLGQIIEFDTSTDDIEDIKSDVGRIYSNIFNEADNEMIHFTLPHKASHTSGTHLHACAQCKRKDTKKIFGVTCVSFFSNELFGVDMQQDDEMYVFLVDSSGKTYVHPKFAEPVRSGVRPFPLDIRMLETSDGFDEIYHSMITGGSGTKNLLVNISVPTYKGQAQFVEKNYTYIWKPIEKSPFSVAVVQSTDQRSLRYNNSMMSNTTANTQMYHRVDLYNDTSKACLIKDSISINGTSGFKLPQEAFVRPVTYHEDETLESIVKMTDYFEMKTKDIPSPPLVTAEIASKLRDSLIATSLMVQEVWSSDSSLNSVYILSRYVGTEDGVMRTYPAHAINPYYDPRVRPWYVQAKSNPGVLVLTTPYEDAFTGTIVLTLTKTVTEKDGDGREKLAAVMGTDLSMPYLQSLLFKYVEECKNIRCAIIDESGYIIFHSDFDVNAPLVKSHIVEKERQVGKHLIETGIMKREHCVGYFKNIDQEDVPTAYTKKFYVVQPITTSSHHKLQCRDYTITPVNGTNMILLKINNTCSNDAECLCPHDVKQACIPASSCQQWCPCYDYSICVADLPPLNRTLICGEKVDANVSYTKPWVDDATFQKLPQCHDPMCYVSLTDLQCQRLGCEWCFTYANGINDTSEKCYGTGLCPSRPTTTVRPTFPGGGSTGSGGSDTLNGGEIAGIVVVVFVVLVAIAILVACLYLKRTSGGKRDGGGIDNRGVHMDEVPKDTPKEKDMTEYGWA